MKTLEQIKNDYAVSVGYYDWLDLFLQLTREDKTFDQSSFLEHEDKVMIIAQKECLRLAVSNKEFYPYKGMQLINLESITNENNIIK